jgi:hypothetical protein
VFSALRIIHQHGVIHAMQWLLELIAGDSQGYS